MERMGMDKTLNLCSLILKFQIFVVESFKMSRKKLKVVLIPWSSKWYTTNKATDSTLFILGNDLGIRNSQLKDVWFYIHIQ